MYRLPAVMSPASFTLAMAVSSAVLMGGSAAMAMGNAPFFFEQRTDGVQVWRDARGEASL